MEQAKNNEKEVKENEKEVKENEKPKNADKKARKFDFESLIGISIEEARSKNIKDAKKTEFSCEEDSQSIQKNSKSNENKTSNQKLLDETNDDDGDDDEDIGPTLPPNFYQNLSYSKQMEQDLGSNLSPNYFENLSMAEKKEIINNDNILDDYDYSGESDVKVSNLIPTICEALISDDNKPITAVAFDQQGSKFATGGYSYIVHLYDFLKMDSSMKSFRGISPCECHIINDLAFNNNGETLLVASGNCQLKLLDRQGKQWAETVCGDQYLVDLSLTKGHTAAVNACCWHPFNKTEFLTCSDDGTLRIWNTDDFKTITKCINTQRKVIKVKNSSGKRSIPTACCYSPNGKLIAAGCRDGSIHIWKNEVNTAYLNRDAHSMTITSLQFSPDSKHESLKLFELKSFKEPFKVVENLESIFTQTDCGFSPHAEFVFTATSNRTRNGDTGSLLFFDSENLEIVYKINYEAQGCVRVKWQPKINQLLVGLSDGTCRIYYDPLSSVRGVKTCISRPIRRARHSEIVREELILSPLTLEMFQPRGEEGEEKDVTEWRIKKYLRMQSNSKRPEFRKPAEMPMSGPSTGGRLARSGGTLHSFVAQQLGKSRNKEFLATDDIRASILRHAEKAETDPIYISNAYKRTQPMPIFQEKNADGNAEDEEDKTNLVFKAAKLDR